MGNRSSSRLSGDRNELGQSVTQKTTTTNLRSPAPRSQAASSYVLATRNKETTRYSVTQKTTTANWQPPTSRAQVASRVTRTLKETTSNVKSLPVTANVIGNRNTLKFKRLSSNQEDYFEKSVSTVEQMKKLLMKRIGVHFSLIEIINIDNGSIYKDSTPLGEIPTPIQVMVGNPDRNVPVDCVTNKPDMITGDTTEPTVPMPCGHTITPDNLFGHMKETLISENKPSVRCRTKNCGAEWEMQEIIKKADMTEDERIFFEYKVSFNLIYHEKSETSECPFCGKFCQRQQQYATQIKCTNCTRKKGKVVEFCWNCKSAWTMDHKCSDNEMVQLQKLLNEAPLKTISYSDIQNVPSTRMCPTCECLIEHKEFCKTMICKKCKTTFCFVCLKVAIRGKLQCGEYFDKCQVAPVQKCTINKKIQ